MFSFYLFTIFEKILRDNLSDSLSCLEESTMTPEELSCQLHDFLVENTRFWHVDKVIEMYNPPVHDQDVNNAKNIRTFRHHVAHGSIPPVSLTPEIVYELLSKFLKNAGLVEENLS